MHHCARPLNAALIAALILAHAQNAPFTLEAALQSVTDRSAAMQAAQASVRASSEAAVKAGQLSDPTLKAGIDNLPVTGPQKFTIGEGFMTMRRHGTPTQHSRSENVCGLIHVKSGLT